MSIYLKAALNRKKLYDTVKKGVVTTTRSGQCLVYFWTLDLKGEYTELVAVNTENGMIAKLKRVEDLYAMVLTDTYVDDDGTELPGKTEIVSMDKVLGRPIIKYFCALEDGSKSLVDFRQERTINALDYDGVPHLCVITSIHNVSKNSIDKRNYLTIELRLKNTGQNSEKVVQRDGKTIQFTCYCHTLVNMIGISLLKESEEKTRLETLINKNHAECIECKTNGYGINNVALVSNHKDFNHANNLVSNLELINVEDNNLHAALVSSLMCYEMFSNMFIRTKNALNSFIVLKPEYGISAKWIHDYVEETKDIEFFCVLKACGSACGTKAELMTNLTQNKKAFKEAKKNGNEERAALIDALYSSKRKVVGRTSLLLFLDWCNKKGYFKVELIPSEDTRLPFKSLVEMGEDRTARNTPNQSLLIIKEIKKMLAGGIK